MKKLLMGSAAVFCIASAPASAQMFNESSPFSGFYAGMSVSSGSATTDNISERWTDNEDDLYYDGNFSLDSDGKMIGAQAGVNFVTHSGMLFGFEVSGNFAGVMDGGASHYSWENDTASFSDWYSCDDDCYVDGHFEDSISVTGMAVAKLGYVTGNLALSAHAGIAMGKLTRNSLVEGWTSNDGDFTIEDEMGHNMSGSVIGVGVDYMVMSNVSVGLSYSHIDYGSVFDGYVYPNYTSDGEEDYGEQYNAYGYDEISATANIMRLSVNYHF